MGVLANGPEGVNPDAKYGFTGSNGSIAGAAGRTQDVIVAELKERVYEEDFGTNGDWEGIDKMPSGPLLWSILNALGKSLLKLPGSTWPDINDLFDGLEWVPDRITEHTEAIVRLDEVAAATNVTAAYVGDLQDMVTVDRTRVCCDSISDGPTKPKYADVLTYDHVDNSQDVYLHRGVTPTVKPNAATGSSLGDIIYTPIPADRVGIVDKIRWKAGRDTSIFSINYYEIALCILNMEADGGPEIQKVWSSGDIKDAEASTTTLKEVVMTMLVAGEPLGQQCTPGQILFEARQQTAPGLLQSTRRFGVAPYSGDERTVPILDACCYIAENHTQGIPSSISFASLTRENRFIPWASVSVNALPGGGP